jgi:CheY-like chemotaxis protein
MVLADQARLRKVLLNLVANAIRFTPAGDVSLTVSLIQRQTNICIIRFEVVDTGIGIDPAKADILFAPFIQSGNSITSEYGGTGLGLFISKKLVELMGGAISLESMPGSGSVFRFDLALSVVDDSVGPHASQSMHSSPDVQEDGKRILLVEDNVMNQKVIVRQLHSLGYATDVVENGQEALDALAAFPYSLVLMDCQMPVMDGYEATRRIRAMEQKTGRRTRIVAMTANAMPGDDQLCIDAGMDDYLTKPVMPEHLEKLFVQRHQGYEDKR